MSTDYRPAVTFDAVAKKLNSRAKQPVSREQLIALLTEAGNTDAAVASAAGHANAFGGVSREDFMRATAEAAATVILQESRFAGHQFDGYWLQLIVRGHASGQGEVAMEAFRASLPSWLPDRLARHAAATGGTRDPR